MAKIILDDASADAIIGELIAASMPQHVGMHWKVKTGGLAKTLDHLWLERRSSPPARSACP